MKASQLERLRQLGELREKGLLTEDEFEEQKRAVMGSRSEPSTRHARRPTMRWVERVVLFLALVVAGAALYLALDARSQARDARTQASESTKQATALRAKVAAFKPTLVLQGVFSRTTRIPSDGFRHDVQARCPSGATAIGGGWAEHPGGSFPEVVASFSDRSSWLVGAQAPSGTSRLDAIGVCLRGAGGLTVLPRF
jgi:Short C-terminal domain